MLQTDHLRLIKDRNAVHLLQDVLLCLYQCIQTHDILNLVLSFYHIYLLMNTTCIITKYDIEHI